MQTNPPYTRSFPNEKRAELLSASIQEFSKCVISGSLCGWGDVFIPNFGLVAFLDVPMDIRIRRLNKRERERWGCRIQNGGDMYETHTAFIEWTKTYDTSILNDRSRAQHDEWLKLLPCTVLRLDGTKPVEELLKQVMLAI